MFWILLGSLLAAQPTSAPPSASGTAVLVLKDGSALLVNSWQVEGRMVRIVGTQGEALLLQLEQLDLPASSRATDHGRLADTGKSITCRSEYRAQRLAEASRRARSDGLSGGLVQLTGSEQPPWLGAPTHGVPGIRHGYRPQWMERFGRLRTEYWDTRRQQAELTRQRNEILPRESVIGMQLGTGRPIYVPLTVRDAEDAVTAGLLRARTLELEQHAEAVKREFLHQKEQARQAGAWPVVYRGGLE